MRPFAAPVVAVLCLTACAAPADPPPAASPTAAVPGAIDPTRVDRARSALPPGYEVAPLVGHPAPADLWGLGQGWTADPPQCAVLADPARNPGSQKGWSASGDGGIAYVFAAAGGTAPDSALVDGCAAWTVAGGPTTGTVNRIDAPPVTGGVAMGLGADVLTVVEGGTETRWHADTYLTFAEGHVVVVAVVTDPGADRPPLSPAFGADLMTKTVAALRG